MSARKRIATLGSLDGVREASLLTLDGSVLESSVDRPTLSSAAVSLGSALGALRQSIPDLGAPVSLTLEGEHGALHLLRTNDKVIALTTTRDANLGAVRLEMRDAIDDINAE